MINLARDLRMHDMRSDPTPEGQQYVLDRTLRNLGLSREDLFSAEELASMTPAQMADAEQQILKMALRGQVWANEWAQEQAEELIQRTRKQCLDEGVNPDTVVLDSDVSRDGEFLSLPELAVQLCTNVSGQMPCSAGGYCEWNQVVQTYAQRYQGRAYPVAAKGSAFVPGRYLRSREAYEAYVGGRREGGPCALCMVMNIAGLDLLCMKGNRDPRHNHRNWPFHMRVAEGELKETAVVGSCARGDTALSAPEGSLPSCSVTAGRPRSTSVFPSVSIGTLVMAWVDPATGERLSQDEFLRLEDAAGFMPQLFVDVEDMQMTADSQVTTRDVRSSASASADGKERGKGGGGGAKGNCCGAHPRGMPRSAYSVPLTTARVSELHGREPATPGEEASVAWMPEWRFLWRRWQQLRAHRREAGTGEERLDGRSGMEFFR